LKVARQGRTVSSGPPAGYGARPPGVAARHEEQGAVDRGGIAAHRPLAVGGCRPRQKGQTSMIKGTAATTTRKDRGSPIFQ
jgi:hypothetical protein